MWTSINLHVRLAFDVAEYQCSAAWHDDPGEKPIFLHKAGTVRVGADGSPGDVLDIVVADLNSALNRRMRD